VRLKKKYLFPFWKRRKTREKEKKGNGCGTRLAMTNAAADAAEKRRSIYGGIGNMSRSPRSIWLADLALSLVKKDTSAGGRGQEKKTC